MNQVKLENGECDVQQQSEDESINQIVKQIQYCFAKSTPFRSSSQKIYLVIKAIEILYQQFEQACELIYAFRSEYNQNRDKTVEQIINFLKAFDFYSTFDKLNAYIKDDPILQPYKLVSGNTNLQKIPKFINPPQIFILCADSSISRQISQHLHLLNDLQLHKSFFSGFKAMCVNEQKKSIFSNSKFQNSYCVDKYQKHCQYGSTITSYTQFDLEDYIDFCKRNRMCPYFTGLNQIANSELVIVDSIFNVDSQIYKYMQNNKRTIIKIHIEQHDCHKYQQMQQSDQSYLQQYVTDVPTIVKMEQQSENAQQLQLEMYVNNLKRMNLNQQTQINYKQTLFKHLNNLSLLTIYKSAKDLHSVRQLYEKLVQYGKEIDIIALMLYFKSEELGLDDPLACVMGNSL